MRSACEACGERLVTFRRCGCSHLDLHHNDRPCPCGTCPGFRPTGERVTVHEHIALRVLAAPA